MVFGRFGAKHKKQGKYWLPRRDAWSTEESQQVTQRRDVTTISALASLKARENLILRTSNNVRTKAWEAEQQRLGSLEKTLPFVFLLFFKKTADDF